MLSFEQWLTLLTLAGGFLTGLGAWLTKSYFPYRKGLQEAREASAALQRQHEQQMAEQAAEEQVRQRQYERQVADKLAEEQARQREFERELQRAKALAETSGENNIWQQMVNLQTKLMAQNEEFSSFIISLATERADNSDRIARDDMKVITEKWTATTYEIRELRTMISVLVQDAARRDDQWEVLQKIPGLFLEQLSRQEEFYNSMRALLS